MKPQEKSSAPQLAVGKGAAGLLGHQALGLHRVLHVEGDLLHQGEHSQLGIFIAKGLQGVGGVINENEPSYIQLFSSNAKTR